MFHSWVILTLTAHKTAKCLEKQQCCLNTEDLAKLSMATANSNNLSFSTRQTISED